MASKINADVYVSRDGDGAPTFPKGGVISGISTITEAVVSDVTINAAGVNAGIVTSSHFKGNLTGDVNAGIATITSQSIIGSGVTINVGGLDIGPGVITATSYTGDGSNLSGVGDTIRTWAYNPDLYTNSVLLTTGIGITFATKIKAGSGNITLRVAGAAGTVVENFGIGSSVTISNNTLSFTPSSSLTGDDTVYYVNYPPGIITTMNGDSYPGTAYTFSTRAYNYTLWGMGRNNKGQLGDNSTANKSSPIQIPGTAWSFVSEQQGGDIDSWGITALRTDGTLWAWGDNERGMLGQNNTTEYSSPVQVGSDTTWASTTHSQKCVLAVKTDGTLWGWGDNGSYGKLGQNSKTDYSSPVQIPGTTWSTSHQSIAATLDNCAAIKTDGTLWAWGYGNYGMLGQIESTANYSSPVQIPGSTWNSIKGGQYWYFATKTDGTLWAWGYNAGDGTLGDNSKTNRSSPTQIPGTDWQSGYQKVTAHGQGGGAINTDGELWTWGNNGNGELGLNNKTEYSSPKQVPGTTWRTIQGGQDCMMATKTDGTFWGWGANSYGGLGQNDVTQYSSPRQVPGTDWGSIIGQTQNKVAYGMKQV